MTTIFALLAQVCGLSQREAAAFLNVRLDTVKSWSAGRNPAAADALDALAELAGKIDAAADEAVGGLGATAVTLDGDPEIIELGRAADDAEARSLGWPCVGAHRAVLALTVARGMAEGRTFAVVPRGSTAATAAAADIHDRHR